MSLPVRRHADVEQDILDLAAWIARDSRDTAHRFLDAVEETVAGLRRMPGKGSPKNLRDRRLAGVRTWAVRGFPNHLVVYEVRPDEVYVFAIVHGSRRYQRLLKQRI
ncbi:MAG: type II toxin-antitoxin system RelE/ParE family toxin [Tepidisphaeraceae bacterium]